MIINAGIVIFFCISCSSGVDINYTDRGELGDVVNVEDGSNTDTGEDVIGKDSTTGIDIEDAEVVNHIWEQIRPIKKEYIFNSDDELCK